MVVSHNIGLCLGDFKDTMDNNTKQIIDNIDKNTDKIREEIEENSKVETDIPEMLSENLNSNTFHELNSARIIDDICQSCPEKIS